MKIYIPVGIVASGKTTACRKWIGENQPAVHIEVDDLRTIFFKKYTFKVEIENLIRQCAYDLTHNWTEWGYNVALDDAVFFLKKYDRECFEEVVDGLEEIIWDFLPLPTDEQVVERRGREGRGYSVEEWVEVAQRQRGDLECP